MFPKLWRTIKTTGFGIAYINIPKIKNPMIIDIELWKNSLPINFKVLKLYTSIEYSKSFQPAHFQGLLIFHLNLRLLLNEI